MRVIEGKIQGRQKREYPRNNYNTKTCTNIVMQTNAGLKRIAKIGLNDLMM